MASQKLNMQSQNSKNKLFLMHTRHVLSVTTAHCTSIAL